MKPQQLTAGDTVAIVSPAWGGAGAFPHRFERGVRSIERHLGLNVRVMPNARLNRSWVSGTIEERLEDLHEAFDDSSIRGIVSTIGGDHSAQLLSGLDMDLIYENPKVFCGFSDITSLLQGIHARTGLVTFYGPALLPEFGEWPEPYEYSIRHFRRTVMTTEPLGDIEVSPFTVEEFVDWNSDEERRRRQMPTESFVSLRAGKSAGQLLVGCLPSMRHLIGTPWQPDFKGRILVIETPEEWNPEKADADLWHLRNAGLLAELAGLVVARPYQHTNKQKTELYDAVLAATVEYGYPVLGNLDIGHGDPKLTLPLGVQATVDGDRFSVDEPAVAV